jgi:hypothetical protein
VDTADEHHEPSKVQQLLDLTDNLPLAVSLMVTVVGYEGCDRTLSRWEEENTHLLSDGCDQRSNLDISIMLSYSSRRMTHGAQELLSLLSLLPDGLSDADLIQGQLPIKNILACKSTLIQVSLAYLDSKQYLKTLVPIREYIRRVHPPSPTLLSSLQLHFHAILSVGISEHGWGRPVNLPQVKDMTGNFHNVIADAISDNSQAHWDVAVESVMDFNRCLRLAEAGGSRLMADIWPRMVELPMTSIHGRYFTEMLISASRLHMSVQCQRREM